MERYSEEDCHEEEILYYPKNLKEPEHAECGKFLEGQFQGWGEKDQLDQMFFPEWRS